MGPSKPQHQGFVLIDWLFSASVTKDCDWKVSSAGFMMFCFENAKNGGFMKATDSNVVIVSKVELLL